MSRIAKERMDGVEFSRVQSSSSINTYRQCPRKYYYSYILELDQKPSVHLIRGHVAHSVIENFFKLDLSQVSKENYDFEMKIILHELLARCWTEAENELSSINLSQADVDYYLHETKEMVQFWLLDFLDRLKMEIKKGNDFHSAFKKLTPKTEEHLISSSIGVQGYIDAIHVDDESGNVKIIDYKTSRRDHVNDDYRLQLAIYALLFHEKYGKYPDQLGLFFFKHGERLVDLNDELLEFARREVERVHRGTKSKDVSEYPKLKSALCRWSTGQCDFYDHCCKDD